MMFCPHCGKKVADSSHFCGKCGARLRESQSAQAPAEQVLYTIGPFGIELWDGHFSIWKWQRRNSVIIELTNLRLCAVPNRSFGFLTVPASKVTPAPSVPFSIPYASITAIEVFPHPAGLGLMDVLDIKYKEGPRDVEKSIASYKNNIAQAYSIVMNARPYLR